ncbi:acyl carrier protein [Nocardia beijingensis]
MEHDLYLSEVLAAVERILARSARSTDDFFDIGGDSVSAVELLNTLEVNLKLRLTLPDIFDARSLDEIASALERRAAPGKIR